MVKMLRFIFKGEVLFAGFLFSSVFKGFFSNDLIDLTLVFMVLSLISGALRLLKDPNITKISILPVIIYMFLALLMLASFLYTPGILYAQDKLLKFITITAWSFFGVFLLIKDKETLNDFIKGLLFFGLITTLVVFVDFLRSGADFFRIGVGEDGGNILGLGRLTGITAIILIMKGFYEKTKISRKIIAFILLIITIFVLMLTSARMPLLALLTSVAFLFFISFNFKVKEVRISKRILSLLFLLPFLVVGFFLTNAYKYFDTMIRRITVMFTQDGGGASVTARTGMYDTAIDMWQQAPFFGKGIGSYAITYLGQDGRAYPHNIFLEFLSELGVFGLLLFLSLLFIAIRNICVSVKSGMNGSQITIIMISIFVLLNVNSSGDMNDNRWLFSFIALGYILPVYRTNTQLEQTMDQ